MCPGSLPALPEHRSTNPLLLGGNIVAEKTMRMADIVRQLARGEIHDVVRTGGAI
jgi:hypothetical protein